MRVKILINLQFSLAVVVTGTDNTSPTSGISGDGHIMDILLNDMQSTGLQKRYSDKDSRVRALQLLDAGGGNRPNYLAKLYCTLQCRKIGINGGNILSEEESLSVTNSPVVSRRRLGSYSGDSPHLGIAREDTCSPG